MKEKGYLEFPLGQEAAAYLAVKRKRLTDKSFADYESTLDKFARYFPTHTITDFKRPAGTQLLEGFLSACWGHLSPRTYNKHLTVLRDFFKWQVGLENLLSDPALPIERAKTRPFKRTTFSDEQRDRILTANPETRNRLALRLLLDFGIRKGALNRVRFGDFDAAARTLEIFTKGEKYQTVRIPHNDFWLDLERLIEEEAAEREHYLLPSQRMTPKRQIEERDAVLRARIAELEVERVELHALTISDRKPLVALSSNGVHVWWYRCLHRAGIVEKGVKHGQRIHTARHTAGQRVFDAGGSVKDVQEMLGHASGSTTINTYLGAKAGQLEQALLAAVRDTAADRNEGAGVA